MITTNTVMGRNNAEILSPTNKAEVFMIPTASFIFDERKNRPIKYN
jgi:hypothetical protein